MKFEKLYNMTLIYPEEKAALYVQRTGAIIDLGTYFNAFSIKKWITYTTINELKICLDITGGFSAEIYGVNIDCEKTLTVLENAIELVTIFNVNEISEFDLIGVRVKALNDEFKFNGGAYFGKFATTQEVKIGVTICTFQREKYLLPNLEKLKSLTARNQNINVMVIDNGRTLNETNSDALQIIHNPNFGGSGGFTRGMIEQVNQNRNTHVLLMDDDVVIELAAFERLYTLLRHLKIENQSKFFAGAMLNIAKSSIQTENTAYWNKLLSKPFGKNFNLSDKKTLCRNEHTPKHAYQYAGWWFCCVPIEVIKKIGYPLPNFIKGDDIEYGIRNAKDILSMNGVGVWHEAFAKKLNTVMKYFSDRSMLLVNHFVPNCGRCTFALAVFLRIVKRMFKGDFDGIRILEPALKDLNCGLTGIVATRADEKFAAIKKYLLNKNIFLVVWSIFKATIYHVCHYDTLDENYKRFRTDKLTNQKFWKSYLEINRNAV